MKQCGTHISTCGDILVREFPPKNVPNVFEINEDKINRNKCCQCNVVFFCYVKEIFVEAVKVCTTSRS